VDDSSNPFDEPTEEAGERFKAKLRQPRRQNDVTRIIGFDDGPPVPFDRAFGFVFDSLTEIIRSFPRDGLLISAVWKNCRLDSYVHLPIDRDPIYAVAGRHDRCDLQLSQDIGVSLRHLLIGATRRGDGDLRIRLWDLASGIGFATEDDLPCEALVCEGPVFIRVGDYQVFFLPTGQLAPVPWGASAKETWDSFPERVMLDRRLPSRSRGVPRRVTPEGGPLGKGKQRRSLVTLVEPPRPMRAKHRPETQDGLIVGHLHMAARSGQLVYPVSDLDLEYGLLVGRYERCHLGGDEERLSRIHILLVRDSDEIRAIDTASTNGTEHDGQEVRFVPMGPATELTLAGVMTLRWEHRAFGNA
jgi:hypothetical protein